MLSDFGVESIPHLHSNDIHVYTWEFGVMFLLFVMVVA